jgi:hypothetical protein
VNKKSKSTFAAKPPKPPVRERSHSFFNANESSLALKFAAPNILKSSKARRTHKRPYVYQRLKGGVFYLAQILDDRFVE